MQGLSSKESILIAMHGDSKKFQSSMVRFLVSFTRPDEFVAVTQLRKSYPYAAFA